jgi:hypothetical protein
MAQKKAALGTDPYCRAKYNPLRNPIFRYLPTKWIRARRSDLQKKRKNYVRFDKFVSDKKRKEEITSKNPLGI